MCRQPDVTVNPDQGHHLFAANLECTALLTLTGEGEAGAGTAEFLFKTSCSQAKSPKAASQGLLRALCCCQPLAHGQAGLCAMSWGTGPLGAGIEWSLEGVCEQ